MSNNNMYVRSEILTSWNKAQRIRWAVNILLVLSNRARDRNLLYNNCNIVAIVTARKIIICK